MRFPKGKNKRGFTMVELIVVIVIILVLAAVLVPGLLKYIDKANQAKCRSDAATILSQIQSDYAAAQASDYTGVEMDDVSIFTIGNVTISQAPSEIDKDRLIKPNTADYYPKLVKDGYKEITSFIYNDGKYVALWTQTDGWELFKNTI